MIALDIECSGTDPYKNSILSIGAIDLDDEGSQFYDECRVWDGAHINDEALVVNGFTKEEALDPSRKSEIELVKAFIAWAVDRRDWTILGQNPSFDRDFLIAACRRGHIDFPFAHRTLDTHTLTYMHMVHRSITPPFDESKHRTSLNLDMALQYVGIPEEPKPHNALTGAMCHAEVASRLLYSRMFLNEFSMYPIPWTVPKKS
ncbi:3'-5' exonuclease [Patescibacteria group bacterium]|nr:MAG: 3'-5' exonuclease [Patescibacteria group bacterium]